jgi:hypothetical protein
VVVLNMVRASASAAAAFVAVMMLVAMGWACVPPGSPYCIDRATGIWKKVDPQTGRASFMTPVPVPTMSVSLPTFTPMPAPTLMDPRPVLGPWTDRVVNGRIGTGDEERCRGRLPGDPEGH